MKKYIMTSVKMTIAMIVLCCGIYFAIVYLIGRMSPGGGNGAKVVVNGKVVGYELVGQKFTDEKYFWGRPSGVDYNAAGSAGSNKGPSNPDYLQVVKDRIDTFTVHHPGVKKEEIPAEMVTASGSGLDPHISPASALIQVKRIAAVRNLDEKKLLELIDQHTEGPLAGIAGPSKINVLKLNVALDDLK